MSAQSADIERAIATIEASRTTHVHWAAYRATGGTADPGAGDEAHHLRCIVEYDHVLAVLRSAERLERTLEYLAPAAERGLTPDGSHALLPGGYCPDCQGCCLRGFAEPPPLVGPSPFVLNACLRCGSETFRPEPIGIRRAARRCVGCSKTVGNCSCHEVAS